MNERIEIVGDSKFIIVDNYVNFELFDDTIKPMDVSPMKPLALRWTPNFPIPSTSNQSYVLNGYVGELDHFIDSLLKEEKPSPDEMDGLKALQLVYATQESIEKGKVVKIKD